MLRRLTHGTFSIFFSPPAAACFVGLAAGIMTTSKTGIVMLLDDENVVYVNGMKWLYTFIVFFYDEQEVI